MSTSTAAESSTRARVARVERREHLFVEEGAERALGIVPALRAEHHAQRPTERRLHRGRHLRIRRLAAQREAQELLALVGAEGEIVLGDLADVAGGSRLGEGEPERPPGRDREPQPARPRAQDALEDRDRVGRAHEALGVVDDEHHRIDQQRVELRGQASRDRERLRTRSEALEQRRADPRKLGVERRQERDEQSAGLALAIGQRSPGRRAAAQGERVLEQRRLAVPGAGDEQDRATVQRPGDPLGKGGPRDPGGRERGCGHRPTA